MTGGKFTLGEAIVGLHFNVDISQMNKAISQLNELGTAIKDMHRAKGDAPGAAVSQATSDAIRHGQSVIEGSAAASSRVSEILEGIATATEATVDRIIASITKIGSANVQLPTGNYQGPGPGDPMPEGLSGGPEAGAGIQDLLGGADSAVWEIFKSSGELKDLWNRMGRSIEEWLPHLRRVRETLKDMGVNANNMRAFLAATNEKFRLQQVRVQAVNDATTKQLRTTDAYLKAESDVEAILKRRENLVKRAVPPTTRLGEIEAQLPEFIQSGMKSWRERLRISERTTNLEGKALKLARQQAQVDRRRARDLLGAAFALTIFGQKLQKIYQGLIEGSTDLFFLQDDMAGGWEEMADLIGGDVAPILEGPIAESFETMTEAVEGMSEGFRGSLGLFILLGSQAASILGPVMAMLATRKMIAASAQMQLMTEKQISLEEDRHLIATGQLGMLKAKQAHLDKKQTKKARAGQFALKKTKGFVSGIGRMFVGMMVLGVLMELMEPFIGIITTIIEMIVETFLPVVEDVAETLIEWGLIEIIGMVIITVFDLLMIALKAVWKAFELVWGAIKFGIWILQKIWPVVDALRKVFMGSGLHAAIEAVTVVVKLLMAPMMIMMNLIKKVINTVLGVTGQFDFLKDVLVSVSDLIKTYVLGAWEIFKGIIGVVVSLLKLDVMEAFEGLKQLFDTVVGWIKNLISGGFDILEKVLGAFGDLIGVDLSGAFDAIKSIFDRTIGWVVGLVKDAWDILKTALQFIIDILHLDFRKAWETLKELFSKVAGWILDIILGPLQNLWNALKDIWNAIKDILGFDDESIDISVNWTDDELAAADEQYNSDLYADRYLGGGPSGPTTVNIVVEGNLTEDIIPELVAETEDAVTQQLRHD